MLRVRVGWMIALGAVIVMMSAGCGEGEDSMAAARQAEVEALTAMKQELDDLRQQLAEAREQAALEPAEEATGDEGAEAETAAGAMAVSVEELEAQVLQKADEFGSKLVAFINADPPLVGEEPTPTQLAAIRMKSDEDILLASTYIDEGGDYKRAIRIYEDALAADPGNQKVEAALAEANELRFMSPERFAAATKGMTRDEVRELLGQVNYRNVREYPDKKVISWFYPTSDDGAAAGVYFRETRGEYVVYQTDYEAVEPRSGEAEG